MDQTVLIEVIHNRNALGLAHPSMRIMQMHNGIGWARKVNQLPIAEMRSIDDENVWPLVIPILFIQPVIKMQGQFVNIRKDVNSTIIFRQPPARFCENVISIVFVKGFKDWPTIHLMPHFSPNFCCLAYTTGAKT